MTTETHKVSSKSKEAATIVMYPTTAKSISAGKSTPVDQIAKDIKKAVKGAKNEKPTVALQKSIEKKIEQETKRKVADLAVFKAVAEHMFHDPHFRAIIEERYGVRLGRQLGIYIRTVGFIIETIFGVWLVVAGPINLSMKVTKFIFHIVFYACIMTVRWLDDVGYIPTWLSQRLRQARTASKKSRSVSSDFKVVE
jgi:hypothetical protein